MRSVENCIPDPALSVTAPTGATDPLNDSKVSRVFALIVRPSPIIIFPAVAMSVELALSKSPSRAIGPPRELISTWMFMPSSATTLIMLNVEDEPVNETDASSRLAWSEKISAIPALATAVTPEIS